MEMGPLVFLTLLLFCIYGVANPQVIENCRTDAYPPHTHSTIETVVVNLDLPPIQRWSHIVKSKEKELKVALNSFKSIIGEKYLPFVNALFDLLIPFLPEPYSEEIRGISIASNTARGEVTMFNLFYELFMGCTSIVGQDESGRLFHARNMDLGYGMAGLDTKNNSFIFTNALRKLVINVEFQRNGKTLYTSTTFAGYVGVATGVKPNAFTFSIDQRSALHGGWVGLLKWALSLGKSKAKWLAFFTREVMENATSYGEAKKMFAEKELIEPVYFILAGTNPGEACVITRDRMKSADIWELNSKNQSNQWYILETNYDHWKKPPTQDDRRTTGNKCMKEMTQKSMGFKGLFNVLSTKPVLNQLTIFTSLMQVQETSESYIRKCRDRC